MTVSIDKLIQANQKNATDHYQIIEWIPFSNFHCLEHIADGGFGSVYKAIWKSGPISSYYERIPGDYDSHFLRPFLGPRKIRLESDA